MKKGFTLIELLAVIIILAILMIIAVPNVLNTLTESRRQTFIAQAQSIWNAAESNYIVKSMSGTAPTCFDAGNLDLSTKADKLTFKVTMNTDGKVTGIEVVDTNQKLRATGTSINNISIVEPESGGTYTNVSCPSVGGDDEDA